VNESQLIPQGRKDFKSLGLSLLICIITNATNSLQQEDWPYCQTLNMFKHEQGFHKPNYLNCDRQHSSSTEHWLSASAIALDFCQ